MYSQTKINHHSSSETHPLAGGVCDLTCDVISLAELQGQLLLADLREGRPHFVRSGLLLTVAPLLGLAGITLFVLGAASLLARYFAWDLASMQMLVAGIVIAVSSGLMWWGYQSLTLSARMLQRSRSEFTENIAWIKDVLQLSPQEVRHFAALRRQQRSS